MSNGRLQVRTFAGNIDSPVSDAKIRITPKGDGVQIIDELISDSSGQTPFIELAAPPLDFSMTGESKPYHEYEVRVMMNGYKTHITKGIQILPDTAAYQNICLMPITEDDSAPEMISIKDHLLWGNFPTKIPENEIKETLNSSELKIPEYIIVHDGLPFDFSAPNYHVAFTDYIKNVASCEVYSTWPDATLAANILAILSFTLNRIHTRWYQQQGYDFMITSSAAYDQPFSYRRNFFKKISQIVDNMFDSYIMKPDTCQPLLMQHFAEKNETQPNWMCQWHSMHLGTEGHSFIDILKHFYGSDIFLMKSDKIEGIPISYPGIRMQIGSISENVKVIQKELNVISCRYPVIPKTRTDGTFGNDTRIAVEAFQRIFLLNADGMVGFDTWHKLAGVYVAVMRSQGN